MKKFFNRVRSYISDHFTCSNPNCGGTMYRD